MISQLAQILESAAADRVIIGLQKNNTGTYCLTVTTSMSADLPTSEQGMAIRNALSVPLMANGTADDLDAGLTAQLAQYVSSANVMVTAASNIATIEAVTSELVSSAMPDTPAPTDPAAPAQTGDDFFSDIQSL